MIDREYIKRLPRKSLEHECIRHMEYVYCFKRALRQLPEVPDTKTLSLLATNTATLSALDLWEIGKEMQQKHGLKLIPPSFECENGAGLWKIIYDALRKPPESEETEGLGA